MTGLNAALGVLMALTERERNGLRSVNRAALKADLERLLACFECQPLADELVRAGVPCAPIQDVATALAAPHTAHREMVVSIGEHGFPKYRGVASPIKLSRTPASYRLVPPKASG